MGSFFSIFKADQLHIWLNGPGVTELRDMYT